MFVCQHVVEVQVDFTVSEEGQDPVTEGGVKAESFDHSCEVTVVDVIEEAFHVEEQDTAL